MARKRDLSAIVEETAPTSTPSTRTPATPTPAPAAAPAPRPQSDPSPATEDEPEATTRSTLDLPRSQHRALQRYALDVSDRAGRSVRGQHVLRALVARLQTDAELAEQIARDLSA